MVQALTGMDDEATILSVVAQEHLAQGFGVFFCECFFASQQDGFSWSARDGRKWTCRMVGRDHPRKRIVSKPQESPKHFAAKGKSAKSKVGRIEAAMKALGQEHSDARSCLEELLKKAKVEEVSAPTESSRPSRCVCCGSPREDGPVRGISGSSGPRRRRRKASLGGGIVEGPSPRNSGEILRTGGQASRESTGSGDRGVEGSDSEGGGVSAGAAPFGGTSCRSCCPARTNPPYDARDRPVGPIAETGHAQVPTPRTGLRFCRQTMTSLWSFPQCQVHLQGQFPAFKRFTGSPGVFQRCLSGIGGGNR